MPVRPMTKAVRFVFASFLLCSFVAELAGPRKPANPEPAAALIA
jgi:hypothetical protein